MALDVSMILRLVDRLSGPAKRAQAAIKGLAGAQGLAGVDRAGRVASRGLGTAERATARLGTTMARAKARVDAMALRALPMLNRAAERTGAGLGSLIRKAGGLALGAAKWGAAGIAFATGALAGGVIGKGSQFEQFQIMLENSEGSAAKAKNAMAWVQKFAAKTPYELDQVMQAFVSLKAYGIDPMDGSLKSLGNAASGMSKDIMQAVEMMADAQTGEFERLKEFGVRAKVAGDRVTFTYMRAGREMSRIAKNSAADIKSALTGIFDERFGGMMDRQSKTLAGMWSNMKDIASGFQLKIGNAGLFDKLKAKAQGLLDRLNTMEANGSLDRWADRISEKLEGLIDRADQFVTGTDWAAAANGMMAIGSAAAGLLGIIGNIASAWGSVMEMRDRAMLNNAARGAFGDEIASRAKGRLADMDRADPKTRVGRMRAGFDKIDVSKVKAGRTPAFRGQVDRSASPMGGGAPAAQPANWPKRGLRVGSAAPVDVKNRVEVAILQPAGMQTRVNAQPGAGGSLTVTRKVNRGHAMSGAA